MEQEHTDIEAKELVVNHDRHNVAQSDIEGRIISVRGVQVMLDRDLAMLYGVETKVLNQAVKRNIERSPEDFMFQLTKEELEILRCLNGTSSDELALRSQIVTSKPANGNSDNQDGGALSSGLRSQIVTSNRGGARYMPYAFTENGVAMLSSVLRSATAIEVNIRIMRAFTAMRHFLLDNAPVFKRIEAIEYHQLEIIRRQDASEQHQHETDKRFAEVFDRLDDKAEVNKQKIFFDGQIYDAYDFVSRIIKQAKRSIILIDNYVDETVLTMLDKRDAGVKATIYTAKVDKQLNLDIAKHNSQYPAIDVKVYTHSHDRFLCIDDTVYHIGASIKDLGKKWFAFSILEDSRPIDLVNKINGVV